MVRVAEVIEAIDGTWPFFKADDWDNVGLLIGDPQAEVAAALLTVDVTVETIAEAQDMGAKLIISHHPLMLQGQKKVLTTTAIGSVIHAAISQRLAIVAMHTNADHPQFGVSEALAFALGLRDLIALDSESGHGRVGLIEPMSLREFAERVARVLPGCGAPIRVSGDSSHPVQKVAVLAGAGGGFMESAQDASVDVYVTSDLKHHQALDFLAESRLRSDSCALIDVSHWAAESLWLQTAAEKLRSLLPQVNFVVSTRSTDPWTFSLQS